MRLLEVVERIPELDKLYRQLLTRLTEVAPGRFKPISNLFKFQDKVPHLTYAATEEDDLPVDSVNFGFAKHSLVVGAEYTSMMKKPTLKVKITLKQPYSNSNTVAESNAKNALKVLELLRDFISKHQDSDDEFSSFISDHRDGDHEIVNNSEYNRWTLYVR